MKPLEQLTKEVRKMKKKNKSLKRYIGSIAITFVKKLKVMHLDCISSSSSSEDKEAQEVKGYGHQAYEGDEIEREIEAHVLRDNIEILE